jgi:hypothetical protein
MKYKNLTPDELIEIICKMETVLEMVVDNTKMPHEHTDPQLRLYCLSERAQEVLNESSTSTS